MQPFLSGAIFMGFLVCCLFFMRAYRQTSDPLFRNFGWAFALMTLERLFLALSFQYPERQPAFYILRLLGFLVIIWGILAKNTRMPLRAEAPRPADAP